MNKVLLTALTFSIAIASYSQVSSDCSVGVVHAKIGQDLGNSSGSITVSIEESTKNHTFKWSNGETTSSLKKVSEGSYSVLISDGNGCEKSSSFFVPGTTLLSESSGALKFDLYPVPTSGDLHLSIDDEISGKRIRVFDSMGKLVMLKTYATDFNVARLPAGLYYFEVEDGNRVTGRRKFIKVESKS